MRSLLLLLALCSSIALAATEVQVASHQMLRLPNGSGLLSLDRLEIADQGTLLIPAGISEIRVAELVLGREARIAIAPGENALSLRVERGEFGSGAQIIARGATGTQLKPASPGRTLNLRLQAVNGSPLLIDARGGRGAPGYAGLDGADGESGGCTWGQATRGHDGQRGGNGQNGAAGGQVRIEVPASFPVEGLQVRSEGGAGGPAGAGGKPGLGGAKKGCWLYSADGARDGRPGEAGQPGSQGAAGAVNVVRF
ncbi:collagen-like protein [Pseudomonas borbori]